jgi:hypothetical protein
MVAIRPSDAASRVLHHDQGKVSADKRDLATLWSDASPTSDMPSGCAVCISLLSSEPAAGVATRRAHHARVGRGDLCTCFIAKSYKIPRNVIAVNDLGRALERVARGARGGVRTRKRLDEVSGLGMFANRAYEVYFTPRAARSRVLYRVRFDTTSVSSLLRYARSSARSTFPWFGTFRCNSS